MGAACTLYDTGSAWKRRFPQFTGRVSAVFGAHTICGWKAARRDTRACRLAGAGARLSLSGMAPLCTASIRRRWRHPAGRSRPSAVVVCPGDDLATLYPKRLAALGVRRCKLQMMRIVPARRLTLPGAVMTDLSLVRYLGYAELPEAAVLRARLEAEQAGHLAAGVHLIVVQSRDGSLVIGDSHIYGDTMDPFSEDRIDRLVLEELHAVFPGVDYRVSERWIGTYASLNEQLMLVDSPNPTVRLVLVTSGTGASTAFAIGEEVITEMIA